MGGKVLKKLTSPIRSIRDRHRERREVREGAAVRARGRGRAPGEGTARGDNLRDTPQIEENISGPNLSWIFDPNAVEGLPRAAKKVKKPVKKPEAKRAEPEGDRSGRGSIRTRKSKDSGPRSPKSEAGIKKSSSKKSKKSASSRRSSDIAGEETSAAVKKGKKPAKKESASSFASTSTSTVSSRRSRGGANVSGYFEGVYLQYRRVPPRGANAPAPTEPSTAEPGALPKPPASDDPFISCEDWIEKDPIKTREQLRERGIEMARWIENPQAANCPISESNMTSKDILEGISGVMYDHEDYKTVGQTELTLYLPPLEVLPRTEGDYRRLIMDATNFKCYTVMSKYIINLENIWRDPMDHSEYPHLSDAVISMYREMYGTTEMLRYIFASTIINTQTTEYIESLYPGGWRNIPHYQDGEENLSKPDFYPRGTPEYQEILGTRIGRTVGSIVLSGFPRGTRRITGIHVWVCVGGLQFRFDLRSN
ncbi:hypothetical protein N7486_007886 [Penicillium sp. IBT 16267x]|nr:hypothetical protein N7486_007886 [Penicillium sp. IBT 16267x]